MIELQNVKKVAAIQPNDSVNAVAAAGVTSVDTLGFDYAVVDIMLGTVEVASTKLQVKQSDTSLNAVAWAASTDVIADFNGGTTIAGGTAALPGNNSDNKIYSVEIDLRGKKRYLAVHYVGGTANTNAASAAIVTLGRAATAPTTAANKGAEAVLRV